jgi:hypothetical protein
MKSRTILRIALFSSATLTIASCNGQLPAEDSADKSEIGASLNQKSDVDIAEIPAAVLAAAHAVRPNIEFTEAEKEVRNGVTYYDVGGLDESGEEIELDIMQDGDGWRVVEVQRDISFGETPEMVKSALRAETPEIAPARIIESDQTDGVIIYEFYTRDANGAEAKYEVKLENGEAEFLTEEWAH